MALTLAQVAYMPLVRLFFVSVYVFGVLVCLNIVVAFALDSFNSVYEESKKPDDESDDEDDADADAPADAPREHTRHFSPSITTAQAQFKPKIPSYLSREQAGSLRRLLKAASRAPTMRQSFRPSSVEMNTQV